MTPAMIERTRFLSHLDEMLLKDRRGALADMLQVLRERGVVTNASASIVVDDARLEVYGDDYIEHMKDEASDMIGNFLRRERVVSFNVQSDWPYTTRLTGEVAIVRVDKIA